MYAKNVIALIAKNGAIIIEKRRGNIAEITTGTIQKNQEKEFWIGRKVILM